MARKRHQNKDIEKVLQEAEDAGWVVVVPKKGYWKLRCECAEKHYRTIKSTPSGSNYAKNLQKWLQGRECWKGNN